MTFPFLTSASSSALAPGLRGGVRYSGPNGGAAGQGRGKAGGGTLAGELEGGQGQGRGTRRGSGCHEERRHTGLGGSRQGGQKGQIAVVKRRKGNTTNKETGARN